MWSIYSVVFFDRCYISYIPPIMITHDTTSWSFMVSQAKAMVLDASLARNTHFVGEVLVEYFLTLLTN